MAVPKQKKTKSRRNQRRSHHGLKKQAFFSCPKCNEPILPHQLCSNCGYYDGRQVVDVLAKLDKKDRKKKEKEMAEQEKEQASGKDLNMEGLSKK